MLAAALAGGALSLIHAYLVINRGANQLASGLALGFFGLGLTALIGRPYVSQNIEGLNAVPIPLLSSLPFVGPIVFNHDLLTYFGYLIGPLIWLFLYRTRWGLSLRAVGESTAVAFSTGRNPARIQYAAVFFGGMMAGLGGAQLSLALTQTWVEGMTSGYGFIGVALVIFAMWQPLRAMLGAYHLRWRGGVAVPAPEHGRADPALLPADAALPADAGDPADLRPEEPLRRAGRPGGSVPADKLAVIARWCHECAALADCRLQESSITHQCIVTSSIVHRPSSIVNRRSIKEQTHAEPGILYG